jgi:rubrerythrin
MEPRRRDGRLVYRCLRPDGTFKVSWRSRAKARHAAIRLRMTGRPRLYAYVCPRCGHWHLTKQAPRSIRSLDR